MAIVENFWLKGQKKKLGGSVIYQAMGQTRQRALASEVRNPRTTSQMNQRVKWANLVNLYRANQSWMKYAFETKKQTQSDYNKFMSLNVTGSNIFLTKDIAAAGGCVVQAYQITQGSLPSIETVYDAPNDWWGTNIYLGPGFIFSNTSVAAFTRTLLQYNPAIREGDQLSFIRLSQMTNADNGAPYVIVRKYEVVLSSDNTLPLSTYLPLDYIDSNEFSSMAQLVVKNSGNAGGFVLVLSRTVSGRTLVSSQRIVVANNSAIIDEYSSPAALAAAIASYGQSDEPFLTSTTANRAGLQYTPLSVLSMDIGDVSYTAGSVLRLTKADASKSIRIRFSGEVTGVVDYIIVNYQAWSRLDNLRILNASISMGDVTSTLPEAQALPDEGPVESVYVGVDDVPYRIVFADILPPLE